MDAVVNTDGQGDKVIQPLRLRVRHQLVFEVFVQTVLENPLESLLIPATLSGKTTKLDSELRDRVGTLVDG